MEKFLLLIREDMEKLKVLPEDEFIACITRMTSWVEDLAINGHAVSLAQPLTTFGRYVTRERVLSDGPFIEAKEAISGVFIIEAENIEDAAALAQSCPQVLNNTSVVEVRQLR